MKLTLFAIALAGASTVSAWEYPWGHSKPTPIWVPGYGTPTPTPIYPTPVYPTPTPTPSGSPDYPGPGSGDAPKPIHKVCVKGLCFAEPPKHCKAGYTAGMLKKCHTCCKEAGGEHPKRNMGQVFAEYE